MLSRTNDNNNTTANEDGHNDSQHTLTSNVHMTIFARLPIMK